MRATLDGQSLTIDRPSLAAALQAGAETARGRGRIVVEVLLDGQPVQGEDLAQPSDETLNGQHLEMTSTDPASLVRLTLFDAADAMDSARDEHAACAEKIHRGDISEAMQSLTQILATWQAVREAVVQGGAAMGRPLSTFAADGKLEGRTTALTRHLDALKRAVGDNDLSTLADVLEEDLQAEAGLWADVLRQIAEGLKPH
jgi:leucyl aminopeptidase (aminopeptidase T)